MRYRNTLMIAALVAAMASPAPAARARAEELAPKERPMFLEPIRIVTDWLKNGNGVGSPGAHSINNKLAGVPLDGSDTAPPNVTDVVDETRNGQLARDRLPESLAFPFVTVTMVTPGDVDTAIETSYRDATAQLAIRYVCSNKDTEKGTQWAMYTCRAILRSLKELMGAPGDTFRIRTPGQVELSNVTARRTWVPLYQEEEDGALIVGGLLMDIAVRDLVA